MITHHLLEPVAGRLAGDLYERELELRYRVLRLPLGMARSTVVFPFEDQSLHLVACAGSEVVGCVLFHPDGRCGGRLFQMAVDPLHQRTGLGRQLVVELESIVVARGVREVTLHARADAIGFYERLGYATFGEPYVEVGLPHRHMRRQLGPPRGDD